MPVTTNTRKLAALLGASGAGIGTDGTLTSTAIGEVIVAGDIATGAVDTAELADNAVTLAKMAGGTDGNLITYDTSGNPAYVATGTSGHVLTSAGADAVPTFQAAIADNAVTLAKMAGGTDGNLITYDTSGDPAYVATGTSGHVLTSAGANAVPTFQAASGGLSYASLWRMTSDFTGLEQSGSNIPVDPVLNWEKDDTYSPGSIGSDMTESSGIFTFPATGVWEILLYVTFYLTYSTNWIDWYIRVTSDYTAGSPTWNNATLVESNAEYYNSAATYGQISGSLIFNVTDVATHKLKFRQTNQDGRTPTYRGGSSRNETYATFKKLN